MIFLGSFCSYDPFYYYFSSEPVLVCHPLISPSHTLPASEKALRGPGEGLLVCRQHWPLQHLVRLTSREAGRVLRFVTSSPSRAPGDALAHGRSPAPGPD